MSATSGLRGGRGSSSRTGPARCTPGSTSWLLVSWGTSALIAAVALAPASLAGCFPKPPVALDLGQTVASLTWVLTSGPPAAEGAYRLSFTNSGDSAVTTIGLVAFVRAEVGAPASYPQSQPVPLPETVAPGTSGAVTLSLPTAAEWPETFVVVGLVKPAGGGQDPVEVAESTFAPNAIAVTPVWPEDGYLDFPVGDYLLLKFSVPVGLDSLRSALALDPAMPVEVTPDTNQDPCTFEIHPTSALAPYTLHTLTLSADLRSADGTTRMGRGRVFHFSTGSSTYSDLGTPAWSADGAKVSWTAPGAEGFDLYVGETGTMTAQAEVTGVQGGTPAWGAATSGGSGAGDSTSLYFAGAESGKPTVCRLDTQTGAVTVLVRAADLADPFRVEVSACPAGGYLAIEANYGGVDAHSDLLKSIYLYNFGSGGLTRLPGHGLTSSVVGWVGSSLLYAATYQQFDNSHHFRYNLYVYDPASASEETLLAAGELDNSGGYSVALGAPVGAYWAWEAQNLGVTIVHRPADIWVMWGLDETSVPAPVQLTTGGRYRDVALAPDGTLVAAAKADAGSWDLVVLDSGETIERSLASGPAAQFAPAWSPDGTKIAYVEARGQTWSVVVLDPATDASSVFAVNP